MGVFLIVSVDFESTIAANLFKSPCARGLAIFSLCLSSVGCSMQSQNRNSGYQVLTDQGFPNFQEPDQSKPVAPEFVKSMNKILNEEISKYNQRALLEVTDTFFILRLKDINVLGVSEQKKIYLNEAALNPLLETNPQKIRRMLHHELGHSFYTAYAKFTDLDEGRKAGGTWNRLYGTAYQFYLRKKGLPENAYLGNSIKDVFASPEDLLATGLLSNYALVNNDEHFAVYAECLWSGTLPNGSSFWEAYDKYASIREMTEVVLQIYQLNSSKYSLGFFRRLEH